MKIVIECFVDIESAPVFSFGMAKGLLNNGVEVFAILFNTIENLEDWKELLDENHLFLFQKPLSFKKNAVRSLRDICRLKRQMRGIRFDYLIDTFPVGIPRFLANLMDVKCSLAIDHDVIPHSSTDELSNKAENRMMSLFDGTIVLSKSFMDAAKEKSHKPVYYMRHGAMEYASAPSRRTEEENGMHFLFFGRIDGYKGLHVLADAYKELTEQNNEVSLTIAGGGNFSEYEEEYKSLQNCTVMNRYISEEEIADLFQKPDTVIVLPYLDASQSGVIGVAFHYGVPVIATDTGGLKEQLFDGEMGLFVKPNDALELKNAMEQICRDRALYEKQVCMMRQGHEKSSWDYVTGELLKQL